MEELIKMLNEQGDEVYKMIGTVLHKTEEDIRRLEEEGK